MKKIISVILLALMLLSALSALSACGGEEPNPPEVCTSHTDADGDGVCDSEGCGESVAPPEDGGTDVPTSVTYSFTVMSEGGYLLTEGITLDIYDSETGNTVGYVITDNPRKNTVTLPKKSTYVARINSDKNPLVGYATDGEYPLTEGVTEIRLGTSLPADGFAGKSLSVHDIMPDFTLTATDGRTLTLSELLGEKKAVVLNLWFVNCNFCKQEFPDMIAAYESEIEGTDGKKYKDEIELIALNPIDKSDSAIAGIVSDYSLSCPVAKDSCGIANAFGISGYPTTVIIDRYGMITLVHSNPIMGVGAWCSLFDTYIAQDYVQEN
ncbi:MAG: redoxin domain-containing protein [Clostridia bacterium]|nr:redoxin domain-containing protein [Clostridia bacterium]